MERGGEGGGCSFFVEDVGRGRLVSGGGVWWWRQKGWKGATGVTIRMCSQLNERQGAHNASKMHPKTPKRASGNRTTTTERASGPTNNRLQSADTRAQSVVRPKSYVVRLGVAIRPGVWSGQF